MSSLSKLRKNADKYKINEFLKNMTPEQYRFGIENVKKNTEEEMLIKYNDKLKKIQEENIKKNNSIVNIAVNMTSIEFLYELGEQLECFIDKPENLEQKIDLVQKISENVMNCIQNYSRKDFEEKRKQVEKTFKIEF